MANRSDIEEGNAKRSPRRTRDNLSGLGETMHSIYTYNSGNSSGEDKDRTKKSVVFNVDTSVAELIAANGDEDSDDSDDGYRDPLLGPCCDNVRAVIYVDIFYIIKNINVIITVLMGYTITDPDDYNMRSYNDDQIQREVDRLDALFWILMSLYLFGIFFASVGIYGASRFSKYLVLSTTIWIFIDIIWSAIYMRWGGMFITMFFVYPHVSLFWALHKGKITRENYSDNKHCCCACCIKESNSAESVDSTQESQSRTAEKPEDGTTKQVTVCDSASLVGEKPIAARMA